MKYEIAKKENIEQIYQLVQNTINAIYPLYYPQGVVEFFQGLHSKENIATDIENGFVRVLLSGDCIVGTGSCKENHISRLFVTSDFQKKGYGSYIMQGLEKEISLNHTIIYLDASLAAACFYEHRGYKTLKHEELFINENARLAYEVMEKRNAACRQYLQLTVDDTKKTEEVLSEKLCVPCTVADSHTVCVYERLDATEEINRAVVTNGIGLKESRFAGEDLEGYFMERIGGPSVQEGDIHA